MLAQQHNNNNYFKGGNSFNPLSGKMFVKAECQILKNIIDAKVKVLCGSA